MTRRFPGPVLAKRIISCLDVTADRIVKGVDLMADIVRRVAERCFIPLTLGGGIRTVDDMREMLLAGADKIGINTSAVTNPGPVDDCAKAFGSQHFPFRHAHRGRGEAPFLRTGRAGEAGWPTMGRRLLSLCLLPLLAGSGCRRERVPETPKAVAIREDGAVELRLMSFNVRYESPDDLGAHAWKNRIAGAIRMIRRIQPDCIGVQEAEHGQAADLWGSLPDYGFFGVGRDDGGRVGEYSGIFYRKDRFRADPADCGTFWLSDTPEVPGSRTWGNEFPRVVAWVRLIDLATGRGFYVFNTHWDHKNQESRERASLLMAERIDARKHADEPVAVIGDFNSNEANPGMIYLTGQRAQVAGREQVWANGMLDTYQALHPGEENRRTLHFWKGNRDGAVKVDHILVSRGAEIVESAVVVEDEPVVSDHFPVFARIRFPLEQFK